MDLPRHQAREGPANPPRCRRRDQLNRAEAPIPQRSGRLQNRVHETRRIRTLLPYSWACKNTVDRQRWCARRAPSNLVQVRGRERRLWIHRRSQPARSGSRPSRRETERVVRPGRSRRRCGCHSPAMRTQAAHPPMCAHWRCTWPDTHRSLGRPHWRSRRHRARAQLVDAWLRGQSGYQRRTGRG